MRLSRAAAHFDLVPPGPFHEHPVRGHSLPCPEHLPSYPEPFVELAPFAWLRRVPKELFLRGRNARTHSPYRHGNGPTTRCRFLLASHTLLKSVLSRARTRGVTRYFRPTSATQFCLTDSLPLCTRARYVRAADASSRSPRSEGFVGSRRRHPLRRDRAIQGRGIRSLPSLTIFVSDVSVTTPVSFLDLSAERASLRDRQDHFHVFAVTQNTLS